MTLHIDIIEKKGEEVMHVNVLSKELTSACSIDCALRLVMWVQAERNKHNNKLDVYITDAEGNRT